MRPIRAFPRVKQRCTVPAPSRTMEGGSRPHDAPRKRGAVKRRPLPYLGPIVRRALHRRHRGQQDEPGGGRTAGLTGLFTLSCDSGAATERRTRVGKDGDTVDSNAGTVAGRRCGLCRGRFYHLRLSATPAGELAGGNAARLQRRMAASAPPCELEAARRTDAAARSVWPDTGEEARAPAAAPDTSSHGPGAGPSVIDSARLTSRRLATAGRRPCSMN